jgi:hypothetical protein
MLLLQDKLMFIQEVISHALPINPGCFRVWVAGGACEVERSGLPCRVEQFI